MSEFMENYANRDPGFQTSDQPIGTAISRNTAGPGPNQRTRMVSMASNSAANVGITTTPILAGNNRRCYLLIQNRGAQNVFITFGGAPSLATGFPGGLLIPPNGFYEPQREVPVDTIFAVAAAGTNLVTIIQGVWTKVYT